MEACSARSTLQALTCLLVVALPAAPASGTLGARPCYSAPWLSAALTPGLRRRRPPSRGTSVRPFASSTGRGLQAERGNGRLGAAAGAHARDMVARGGFFADHVSPEGTTPESRAARGAGYGGPQHVGRDDLLGCRRSRRLRPSCGCGWPPTATATSCWSRPSARSASESRRGADRAAAPRWLRLRTRG